MGFFDKLFSQGKKRIGITDLGAEKYSEMNIDGVKLDVLAYLNSTKAATIREIADNTHIEEPKVKKIVEDMGNEGWVEAR